jgi:hypothetical protein
MTAPEMPSADTPSSTFAARFSSPELDSLSADAGSESAVSRGRWLAGVTVLVGMVGALGVAMRPVLARRFAPVAAQRDAVSAAIEARRVQAGHVDPRVRVMMDRLAHLRRSQLERHPMWHGFAVAPPPPQLQPPSSGAPPRAASKLN